MKLLMTDDEVVALAVSAASHWPTGLPTVPVEEEAALLSSALRGRRSLAVRDLVRADSPANDMLEAVRRDVLGADGFVCLYVADQDLTRAEGSLNINAFRSGDDWLVETVSDVGVHQFAICTTDELRNLFVGLARSAHEQGLADGQPGTASVNIEEVTSELRSGISVRRQSVRRSRVAGDAIDLSDIAAGDLDQEIDRLLGRGPV